MVFNHVVMCGFALETCGFSNFLASDCLKGFVDRGESHSAFLLVKGKFLSPAPRHGGAAEAGRNGRYGQFGWVIGTKFANLSH